MNALVGVGDAARGQWEEWTSKAYHVRRRLTADEECVTGPAVDVRRTPESLRRIRRVQVLAPFVPAKMLLEER